MGTNVKRRLSNTAGMAVALTAAALSVAMASPASANEASASPEPTASAEPSTTASPEPTATPVPTASTTPSTTASPKPTATPSTPAPTPCTDKSVTITGRVWNDLNHNGIQDASEPGLPNIPLMAFDDVGLVAAKKAPGLRSPQIRESLTKFKAQGVNPKADDEFPGVFTDSQGKYTITGLQAGPIMVALIPYTVVNDERVEDWLLTDFEQGSDRALDSDFFGEDGWGWSYHESTEPCDRLTVDGGLYKAAGQPTPTATATPAPGTGGGSLPNTGLAIGGFLVAGIALIGGGAALTIVSRRRRQVAA